MRYFLGLILLVLTSGSLSGQTTIKGSITSTEGEILVGVNILEVGTTNGTITDVDGNYSLSLTANEATLKVTYVGYEPIVFATQSRTRIDLQLKPSSNLLNQIVVNALGFVEKKDKLGSTASVINTKDITRSGESTFLNSLGAKASNLQISRTNGDPGAGTIIRIRGANSIAGSSNPLIIVDGIPVSNQTIYGGGNNSRDEGVAQQSRLHDLNPNDVESVQILKGASATALWGSRAANGVVVITTKDGTSGKMSIDYTATLSFDHVFERFPLQSTWGQGRNGSYSPTLAESWGDYIPDRLGGADEFNQSGEYFEAENGTLYYPIEKKNSKTTFLEDNWDEIIQTGGFLQHNLNISGGTETTQFFFSLGHLDQEGIIKNNDYRRTNVRLNSKSIMNDWLSISSKSSFSNSQSNRIQQGSNTAAAILGLLRTPPDFDNSDYIGTYVDKERVIFPLRHRSYRRYLGDAPNPSYNNPNWAIHEQKANTIVNHYTFSGDVDILPTDFLQIKLRGGVDGYTDSRLYFFPIGSAKWITGEFTEDIFTNTETNFDAIIRSTAKISSDVSLRTTLGWNYNDRHIKQNSIRLQGFNVNVRKPTSGLNTSSDATQFQNLQSNIRSNRGYLIFNFDIFNRLFVNFSGALEASSTVKNQFFYPSADIAYQLVKKKTSNSFIDFAKLRASFGKVGIQPPVYAWETLADGSFSYGQITAETLDIELFGGGFRLGNVKGNPDLKPEIKTEWEIGGDFRLFNEKLALGVTYYQNEINDIIIPVTLTPSSGFESEIANAASMENKGFEIEADYAVYNKGDFSFNIFGNWSNNKNTVLDIKGAESFDLTPGAYITSRVVKGESLGVLYGTSSQMDESGNLILDGNGFPQLTDRPVVLGDPNPDWMGGLGLGVKWKSFFANALIEHSHGGVFSPRTLWALRRFGVLEETANRMTLTQDLVNYDEELIPAGTTVRGNIGNFGGGDVLLDESWYRTGIGGGSGVNQAYNFSLYDATFTRFKELTIGYVLNSPKIKEKTKLSSITFTFTGRNLFLLDDIPGVDPESNQYGVANSRGQDYFTNPTTKSYLFSIRLSY